MKQQFMTLQNYQVYNKIIQYLEKIEDYVEVEDIYNKED